jgi:hypothetical protein
MEQRMKKDLDIDLGTPGDTRGDITHFKVRLRPRLAGTDAAVEFVQASVQYQSLVEHRVDTRPLVERIGATWGIDSVLAEQLLNGSRRGNFNKDNTLFIEASPDDLPHVRTEAGAAVVVDATAEARIRRVQLLLEVDARIGRLSGGQAGTFEQLCQLLTDLRFWCAHTGTCLPQALDASFVAHMEACLVGISEPGH